MSPVSSPSVSVCVICLHFSAIARRTADWLGVDIHLVKMDEEALAARFEDTTWYSEVPLPDLNGMGRLALADAVHAQGIKVVITGQ